MPIQIRQACLEAGSSHLGRSARLFFLKRYNQLDHAELIGYDTAKPVKASGIFFTIHFFNQTQVVYEA